jgi:radical SAM superfamily enzyme YgiQ (UPF0313 family)
MNRILLINPKFKHLESILPPTGLSYLAAVLEKHKVSVKILDANALDLSLDNIQEEIASFKPTIVGITCTTPTFREACEISKSIKSKDNKIHIVFGGAHPTILPEETIKQANADSVIRGEGELTLLEIAEKYDGTTHNLNSIDGLVFVDKKGKIIHNQSRCLIENLNELPFPARHLLPMDRYFTPIAGNKFITILTSRGCPGGCIFCTKFVFGSKFRARTPENIVEEIEQVTKEYDVRELNFMDDAFTCDAKRVEELCDLMIEKKINIPWRCSGGTRVDMVTEKLLSKMKKAGCIQISYGVESGDDGVLKQIGKQITTDQIREAFKKTKNVGIETVAFFMFGLPFDTIETMEKTIKFAKEIDPDYAQFTIATPLPGTPMYYWVKKYAKKILIQEGDLNFFNQVCFETENFKKEDVLRLYKKAYKEFYLRPGYIIKRITSRNFLNNTKKMWYAAKSLLRLIK